MSVKSPMASIGCVIQQNKTNDIMEFLIILNDVHYSHSIFQSSDYSKLLKQSVYFPGTLHIINIKKLKEDEYKDYIVEGNVMVKKLYAKLPKEKIYVDFANFNEKYFNSKINELISIFSVLKAEKIILSMYSETSDDLSVNFMGGVRANNVDVDVGSGVETHHSSKLQKKWEIKFSKTSGHIKTIEFVDTKKFYYLPKEPEWIEIIRKRISRGMVEDNYVYNYYNTANFSAKLFTNLNMLHVDANFNSDKYNNITIEYEVTYYPEIEIQECDVCGDKGHSRKDCTRKEATPETMSFYAKLKGILF